MKCETKFTSNYIRNAFHFFLSAKREIILQEFCSCILPLLRVDVNVALGCGFTTVARDDHRMTASEFLAAKTEVPGSIPSATRFSEQQWVWNGVHSAIVRVNEELLERKVAALV
jgi:hypothetical protein